MLYQEYMRKIEEKVSEKFESASFLKKKIINWALGIGRIAAENRKKGEQPPMCYSLANRLVFSKVKNEMGFNETKYFSFGAAPMKESTLNFFKSLDILIGNSYGMSESTGPQFVNVFRRDHLLTCGKNLGGTEGIIFNPDSEGKGEICFRGRNRFMGYWKNEKATMETIDDNGYIHSGDQGKFNQQGSLIITGRIKELIVTAGGENIAPVPLEEYIKDNCKIISNCIVIGDFRKYLTVLITLKVELNGSLNSEALTYLLNVDKTLKTFEDCAKSKKIQEMIQHSIDIVNKASTSRAHQIRKWTLLKSDFSVDTGEFTPTLKLKRKVVEEKYKKEIELMYSDSKF